MKEKKQIIFCRECGCVVDESDSTLVNIDFDDEGYVCDDCLSEYFRCSHCGRYYSYNHEWARDGIDNICSHCSEHYEICSDCSQIISNDNALYLDGEYYCSSCYDSRMNEDLSEIIEEYGYKPEPVFLGECEDDFYIGVELEVDKGDGYSAANSILGKFYNDTYLKHDGSLETGFEIVSHPATLDYHKYELGWDDIVNICQNNNMKSHDTKTCGLHCHVSRLFFGSDTDEQDLHIAKLILLINKFWESHIVPFSRRNAFQLDRWAAKPVIDIDDQDSEAQIVDKVKNTKYAGRYQGINLQNETTVEFRMFRGTLKLNTLIATLQFVDCICRFAKAMKLSDIYTVNWSDLFEEREEQYPELFIYLKEKDLI